MPDAEYFEARRYSAVVVHDDRLVSLKDVLNGLDASLPSRKSFTNEKWSVERITFKSRRNYYPPGVNVRTRGSGHPHEMYVVHGDHTKAGGMFVVAAPYVRLLAEAMRRLDEGLQGDAPLRFARPSVDKLFDHFQWSTHRFMRASRIEVCMRQSGLDRVALSGRNPLRSDLRQALHAVSLPYSIRVQCSFADDIRATNVNLDAHGNFHWHLSNERSWDNVVPLLDLVLANVPLEDTEDFPFRRLSLRDDDE